MKRRDRVNSDNWHRLRKWLGSIHMLSVLSAISIRPRQSWLVSLWALAALFVSLSEPALAQCTPVPPTPDASGNATCTSTGSPYTSGISYAQSTPGEDVHVILESGVHVDFSGPGNAVSVDNLVGGSAILTANGVTINVAENPTGSNGGLAAAASSGSAIITASGKIDVPTMDGANAIDAFVVGNGDPIAVTSVIYNGPSLSSSGPDGTGIQANSVAANGKVSIDASGNVSGFVPVGGQRFSGLFAEEQGNGDASVIYRSGTISVRGNFANGIFAGADNDGSAEVTTLSGTTIIISGADPGASIPTEPVKPGIDAESSGFAGKTVTETVASTIQIFGKAAPDPTYSNNPVGIRALSFNDAPITVDYTGPGITTQGGGGIGILALSGNGGINVTSDGPIDTTTGVGAVGILADSGTILNEHETLPPTSTTGLVKVSATNVSAQGEYGVGISATGGSGGVMVNIPSSGSIMGGWQPDVNSVGVAYGLPAAGVMLGSSAGSATLTNDGSLGALSDRAVASPPPTFHGDLGSPAFPISNNTTIINNGTITGFTQLVGAGNSIVNNGAFNLRHFADTDGDGVRDTVRVAVADLGTGSNNSFANNETLALAAVSGATKLDSTGQYLPLGQASNSMALGGPLQGQIIGVSTFTNSGTIDLQSNPAPGDVLMITGGRGGSAPGTGGGGTFISNGGSLLLDTLLNEGGAATISDTLVVDGTSVGPKGATEMSVRNAGGPGAETVGNGILVVQVLDPSRSLPGVFALAGEVRGGAFDYDLFHGGVGGSDPQDWFLRSTFEAPPTPIPPTPSESPVLPPAPPPSVLPPDTAFPIVGPELATYGVVQPLARQLGLSILGTLDDRVGDTYEPDGCAVAPAVAPGAETSAVDLPTKKPAALPTKKPGPALAPCPLFAPSVWGRFFGQTIDNRYQAFTDPHASGNLGGFQGGIDLLRGSLFAGQFERMGLYGAYGDASVNVDGLVTNAAATAYVNTHTGSVNINAWSGGTYWTHVGPGGWYLDTVLQGTSYGGSASTQYATLATDGWGFIASLEGGVPFAFPQLGPGFVLEPQGQILWQKVSFGQRNDGLGEVALGDTTGPSGRIELRGKWTIVTAGDQVWQPYVRGNLWQDWGPDANTVFGTDGVPLVTRATLLEFGGGLTGKINASVSVFANIDYEFQVGAANGERQNGVRGAFGARYAW